MSISKQIVWITPARGALLAEAYGTDLRWSTRSAPAQYKLNINAARLTKA
jgi:hypothetical protein